MMKDLGILVIHGIGTESEDYDVPFREALFKGLKEAGYDTGRIAYGKVYWAEYLNARQKEYYDLAKADKEQKLGWRKARDFAIKNLSDAAAYQRKQGRGNKNYFNIIRRIHAAVCDIKAQLQADDRPLLIFAHSLGGFIINNYIWDAHKSYDGKDPGWPADIKPQGKFESMVNLAGMMTFGCNIPLFVIGQEPVEAIRFPHPELDDRFRAGAEWHNYYDPKDILGWPLKKLNYSFEGKSAPPDVCTYPDVVTADHYIRIWRWNPLSWTPMSHVFYWTHPNFLKPAAAFVAGFLDGEGEDPEKAKAKEEAKV